MSEEIRPSFYKNAVFKIGDSEYIALCRPFLLDLKVSFEAKGCYAEYEANVISWNEIPEAIQLEIYEWFENHKEFI